MPASLIAAARPCLTGQGTRDKGQGTRDKGQGTRDKAFLLDGFRSQDFPGTRHGAFPARAARACRCLVGGHLPPGSRRLPAACAARCFASRCAARCFGQKMQRESNAKRQSFLSYQNTSSSSLKNQKSGIINHKCFLFLSPSSSSLASCVFKS